MTAIWFVLGAWMARWLNRCIERWPHIERVDASWRSTLDVWCPEGTSIPGARLLSGWRWLPVVGWNQLLEVPRSRRWRYATIELVTGLIVAGLFLCEVAPGSATPWTASSLYHQAGPLAIPGIGTHGIAILWGRFLFHLVLVAALVVATWIDFDYRIIPDSITLPAAIVGLVGQLVLGCGAILPVWYQDPRGLTLVEIFAWVTSPDGSAPAIWTWMSRLRGTPEWSIASPHLHGLAVGVAGAIVGLRVPEYTLTNVGVTMEKYYG